MSTTMNRSDFTAPLPCRRAMLAGVCAALAAFIGVPVWVTRAAAALLLLWHPIAAIVVYLAFAIFIRHGRGRFSRALAGLRDRPSQRYAPDASPQAPLPPLDGLASRFATLDLRLARLEARSTDPDRLLRRRFDRL